MKCSNLILVCFCLLFSSCLKDKLTHTYRIYTPVFKSADLVRSEIKSGSAQPVKNAGKIVVHGDYIFLNEIDKGVHVIDNRNPAAPVNISFINIAGNLDMAVKGDMLYADLFTDLVTIDISNPLAANVKKIIKNAFPQRTYNNGFYPATNQFVVDWIERDTTVHIEEQSVGMPFWLGGCPSCNFAVAQPFNSSAAATTIGVAGSMARFSLFNDNLYAVSSTTLNVNNISNTEDPKFIKGNLVGQNIETIFPLRDKLFIGSASGVFIYSISAPESPVMLSQFSHLTACDPVVANNTTAFVTLRSGARCSSAGDQLDVLDISNITAPKLQRTYPMKNPKGLSIDGNLLFICDDGLKVFDAANPANIIATDHASGFESYDIITLNNLAIVVTNDGILQYRYNGSGKLSHLSSTYFEH